MGSKCTADWQKYAPAIALPHLAIFDQICNMQGTVCNTVAETHEAAKKFKALCKDHDRNILADARPIGNRLKEST